MSFYNGIITNNLQRSREFYTATLGFTVKFENEWFVLLERDGRELAFMLPDLEIQDRIFRKEFNGNGLWIAIEVHDLEAEYARIKTQNIPITVELRTEEWGETHFSIVDPNGIGIDVVAVRTD